MNYNEKVKSILGYQEAKQGDVDNIIIPLINSSKHSLYLLAVDLYYLGVINGKQAERARRAER